ncbi:MAG: cytidylate kinase family protein [Candidatus Micrarchaeota archaeon]
MRVAISGLSGCGNSTVSKLVAEKTGFPRFNYTFHDLARDLGEEFMDFHAKAASNPGIDLELDRKQQAFINENKHCVVGTRLAVWMDDAKLLEKIGGERVKLDFKVWLDAPLEERARRVAEREGGSQDEAQAEVIARDLDNALRYKKLYGIDVSKHGFVDLAINSEELTAEEVSQRIVIELDKR